jgi:hypothetical protein
MNSDQIDEIPRKWRYFTVSSGVLVRVRRRCPPRLGNQAKETRSLAIVSNNFMSFDPRTMKQSILDFLALLGGGVAAVAGIVAAAYWIFKLFSEKWLTAKFEERLAAYKHQQQKELEELRFKISGLLDRTTKLYQREFEVLPEAWGKLVITHGNVQGLVAAFQQYPDLDHMSAEQLAEFVDKSALKQWQKEELRQASSKTEYYQTASRWTRFWEVSELFRDYFIY